MRQNIKRAAEVYRTEGLRSLIIRSHRYLDYRLRDHRATVMWFFLRVARSRRVYEAKVGEFTLKLHPDDRGISKELALYHCHEPLATGYLKRFVGEQMIAVDVGGNIGYYTVHLSSLVGSKGTVIAIEPDERNCELLAVNIRKNDLDNVKLVPGVAIGRIDGSGKLCSAKRSNWHSLQSAGHPSGDDIHVKRLDTLVDELHLPTVDFIKMDIEGFEVEAIHGMVKTLQSQKPNIMMEMHYWLAGPDKMKIMLNLLETLGYRAEVMLDRSQDYAWTRDVPLVVERPTYADLMRLSSWIANPMVFWTARDTGGAV